MTSELAIVIIIVAGLVVYWAVLGLKYAGAKHSRTRPRHHRRG